MDKLQAMQVFTRVVDSNSFSGAADALQITRSSVTTIIQNLEAYLKVRLLNRTTRRISLTPEGAAYYARISSFFPSSPCDVAVFTEKALRDGFGYG